VTNNRKIRNSIEKKRQDITIILQFFTVKCELFCELCADGISFVSHANLSERFFMFLR